MRECTSRDFKRELGPVVKELWSVGEGCLRLAEDSERSGKFTVCQ